MLQSHHADAAFETLSIAVEGAAVRTNGTAAAVSISVARQCHREDRYVKQEWS